MTFYVSDSLKGRISEDDLIKKKKEKKINSADKLYTEIMIDGDCVYCGIESLELKKCKVTMTISIPDSSFIFEKIMKTSDWTSASIKVLNDNTSLDDHTILELNEATFEIIEVRKSLLGYNYVATIVIHK
jgi:hypothetical protein